MTKEELDEEAEEFTDSKKSFWRQGRTCIDSVKQAYIAGAEPREKRIAELEAQTKWHKVSEELPTEEKQYLLKFKDGTIDVFYVGIDGNLEPFIVTRECFNFYKDVEKWCEIPEE